jgi:hypothetical protein
LPEGSLKALPDFGLAANTDLDGVTRVLAGSIVLPYLRYEAIDAGIRQARANLHAAEAMRRRAAQDLAGQAADLSALRHAERQVELLETKVLLPRPTDHFDDADQLRQWQATLLELLDALRVLIAIRRLAAEIRSDREG